MESRVGYVNTGSSNRRIVAARFPRTGPVLVAASHLFIAWSRDWSGVRRPDLHDDSLVVYNAGGARILYRARIPRKPRIDALYSLALQSDGTVAALLSREGVGCEHPQLVWARPGAAPAVHIYRSKPALGSSDVELVDSRLLFLREATKRCESSGKAELVLGSLVSLDTRVLGRYDPRAQPPLFPGPTFDFDGTRSVFSEGTLSEGGRSGSTTVFVDEQR